MANSVIKFYRGLEASYNSTTHSNGLYFTTDSHKIILNGSEYGGDSKKKVLNVELNAHANGVLITFTDSTSKTLLFGNASAVTDGLMSKEDKTKLDNIGWKASSIYESALDPTVSTVEDFGGIVAGTTVSELTGETYNSLLDTLIFPTVNPIFSAPSASISLKGYQSIQEVGTVAPISDNFSTGYNAGAITIAGKKQADRGGVQIVAGSKLLYGSNKVEVLPTVVIAGSMNYYYRVSYSQGPQPKDSKGKNYSTPLAAGIVDSSAISITGYVPAYSGLVTTSIITEAVIKSMMKSISAKKTIKVAGPISEQFVCFAAPVGWSVSNIKDSNNFDVTSSYATSTVAVTGLDGKTVNYTVYLSGKMTQPGTYFVNFN